MLRHRVGTVRTFRAAPSPCLTSPAWSSRSISALLATAMVIAARSVEVRASPPTLGDEERVVSVGPANAPAAVPATRTAGEVDAAREFWSFRPLSTVDPPEPADAEWCRTPIDRFVLARIQTAGLRPNPLADRRTALRRASFALLGLPPTPEDVDSFIADSSPDAWERRVDDLLRSPRYGERQARFWLDVARFAESSGFEHDSDRPNAYPYRDFLIRAFNADLPWNRFIEWQIAGDELAPDEPLALAATGFLGAGVFPTQLTETEFERARYDEIDDMLTTTGVAFLGLAIGCARCHDHKFDPIRLEDYYRLAAAFTTTIRSEIELRLPESEKPVKVQVTSEGLPHVPHHADGRGFPHFYPEVHVLERGDVRRKREIATLGFLPVLVRGGNDENRFLVPRPDGWTRTSFRRASLARWITDATDGAGQLAARVIVNRIWQQHFGRGLVATPNDFGHRGEFPSHPELLDWLARDFLDHGQSIAHVHRQILSSSVFLQTGDADDERLAIDRENVLLWRWRTRRLEGEAIRDSLLAVSGELDSRMFGPGSLDTSMKRRSIYFTIKRSALIPDLMVLDWPEHLVSIGRRVPTTTAPQALLFLNSRPARRSAGSFAKRAIEHAGVGGFLLAGEVEAEEGTARIAPERTATVNGNGAVEATRRRIVAAYRIALARLPSADESITALRFIEAQTADYVAIGASDAYDRAWIDFAQALLSTNEFVHVD
jgi:hypothetical protein